MRSLLTFLFLIILTTACNAETIAFDSTNTNVMSEEVTMVSNLSTMEEVFYVGKKEVARMKADDKGNIVQVAGIIPDGIVKKYYDDGRVWAEWMYKDNKANGSYKEYYENGSIKAEGHYKDGKLAGQVKRYWENGILSMDEQHSEEGSKEFTSKVYSEQGIIMAEYAYSDIGFTKIKSYNEKGNLIKENGKEK